MVADRPRLRRIGFFERPQLLEQHEVLHVAGAKLDDIYICEQVEMLFAHDLGDDRQTGLTLCLEQQLETLGLQTLERVRGGTRLECAAAQEGGARQP